MDEFSIQRAGENGKRYLSHICRVHSLTIVEVGSIEAAEEAKSSLEDITNCGYDSSPETSS